MISAGDLRKGTTFEFDGQVFTVTDFLHVKPGKGAAFVRTKLRKVISGGDVDRTFADISKAKKLIGYNPKTSFKEGIERFIKWYKENIKLYK